MKTVRLSCGMVLVAALGAHAQGQGTFQNLDFEEVNLPNLSPSSPPTFVAFNDAFPGWTGYYNGTNQFGFALYNGFSVGGAVISIITTNTPFKAIAGNYTAALAAGSNPDGGGPTVPVAIAQTGLIPIDAQSLRFSMPSLSAITDLKLTLNGQDIPFFPLLAGANYAVYGGDISAFAGLTAELRFTEWPGSIPDAPRFRVAFLDDISFSPQAVPEPSVFGLFALGSLLLGWRWRCNRK